MPASYVELSAVEADGADSPSPTLETPSQGDGQYGETMRYVGHCC